MYRAMTDTYGRLNRALGPLLGFLALGLYVFTLSRGPYPGESAALMARELGLDPFRGLPHPLWNFAVELAALLPLGELSLRLNLMSAVCGALAVWVFFRVVSDAVWLTAEVTDSNRGAVSAASLAGGVAAALALMGAMPFWYASNRFHSAMFHMLYLLIVARVFIGFARTGRVWRGLLFGLLYGIGVVEFATFIVLAPLAALGVLLVLWYEGDFRWPRVLAIGAAGLCGLLFYAAVAWRLMGSDEYALMTDGSFWKAFYYVWHGQYVLIARGLPQLGWLLVILVGIVPWLAVLLVARRGLNEEKDWGFFILHFILTGVAAAVLFNAPFAPWRLLGPVRLLVTPYLLTAFVFGYLTAYWFLFPRMWGGRADPEEERGLIWLHKRGGWGPALVLVAAAVGAGTLNFHQADARAAGPINAYARALAKSLADYRWAVSAGILDDNVAVAAREEGGAVRLLDTHMGNNATYMRWVARSFEDPRLKSLAEVDGLAFLREWIASDTNFSRDVAILSLPDLWVSGGYQPIPQRMFFSGSRSAGAVDADALWARHQAFWSEPFLAALKEEGERDTLAATYAGFALRHTALVANNLGVLLEDLHRPEPAYQAYAKAREIDPANVSALLNQIAMLDRGFAASNAAAVRADMKEFVGNLKQKLQIWSLSRYNGYVRMPEAFANLGMAWALSGEPGMAVAGYKRAVELAPDRKDQLSYGLARAYLAQDDAGEGEALYRGLLAKEPKNLRAMVALVRLMAGQNRFDEAAQMLDQAEKAGLAKEAAAMEYATMHMAAGDLAKARVVLQEVVELKPDMAPAWAMLAGIFMQMNDTKALAECERRLARAKGKDFLATVVLAQIALNKADNVTARTCLDTALALRPATPLLLELLLKLDVAEGRRDAAGQHVRSLLLLDSDNSLANQVLASFQIERKDFALAENTLRKSLERQRSPSALNDLAWVRYERGGLDEAEKLAREALQADPKQHNFWDTLGMILMKQGRLAEAEEALTKAVSLYVHDTSVQVHLVELYVLKKDQRRAVELANSLLSGAASLKPDDRDKMRQIVRRAP